MEFLTEEQRARFEERNDDIREANRQQLDEITQTVKKVKEKVSPFHVVNNLIKSTTGKDALDIVANHGLGTMRTRLIERRGLRNIGSAIFGAPLSGLGENDPPVKIKSRPLLAAGIVVGAIYGIKLLFRRK